MNTLAVVSAATFSSGEADSNGKMPVILRCIAGRIPNRNVLSGTIAENEGFIPGKAYLAQVRETEASDEYGRQFVFTNVSEASMMDIVDAESKLGPAVVYDAALKVEKVTEGEESPAAAIQA